METNKKTLSPARKTIGQLVGQAVGARLRTQFPVGAREEAEAMIASVSPRARQEKKAE